MTLWLLFLVMTALAIAAVLWPLARRRKGSDPSDVAGNDVAVYRDQLEEIERDRAAGAIGVAEAEAARVEVSRRLLAAADASAAERKAGPTEPVWRRRAVALITLLAVPLGAASLYLRLGSPDLPDQPLAARLERVHAGVPMTGGQNQGQSMEALVARVEAYLDKNPEDGRGWEVIAPVYMRTGNYEGAVKARANALRLLGSTADREADHGETMVAAADGIVTAEAKAAFERAIKLDKANVSARFYLGLAADQDGRKSDAIAAWTALIADAPPGADWIEFVRRSIARAEGKDVSRERPADHPPPPARTTADVGKALGLPPAPAAPAPAAAPAAPAAPAMAAAPAAPTAAPPAAAAPDADPAQNEMIRGMVTRLADRLKQDGSDVEGWLRLMRSYLVMGEADKARAAAADARRALGQNADKLRQLDAGVKDLGLGG